MPLGCWVAPFSSSQFLALVGSVVESHIAGVHIISHGKSSKIILSGVRSIFFSSSDVINYVISLILNFGWHYPLM